MKKNSNRLAEAKKTGVEEGGHSRERVIRKSYALTKQDIDNIKLVQDKCLNRKIVLNDSYVIRLALSLAVKLSEDDLIKTSQHIPKIATGRPKGS